MKKILILTSSPRKSGNTNSIVKEVAAEIAAAGAAAKQGAGAATGTNAEAAAKPDAKAVAERNAEPAFSCEIVDLTDLDIKPCLSCRCCQTDWDDYFCVQEDDLTCAGGTGDLTCVGGTRDATCAESGESLADKINSADMLVLATPIYSWYCTPPMKALLDRCVYAFNKYYDDVSGTHGGERGPALWAGKKVALITTCGYPPEQGADLLEEGLKRYCKHSQLEFVGTLVERNAGYTRGFMDEEKVARAKAFARGLLEKLQDNTHA